jgi:hypothetical protein
MAASKLSVAMTADIAARMAAGAPLTDAARAAGVHPQTVRRWLARGRRDSEGAFAEFAAAVERARVASSERQAPVTQDEFRQRLEEAVRAGSVNAMALWARLYLRDDDGEAVEPASMIDLLAERRRRGREA